MFVLGFDNTDNSDKKVERNSRTKHFVLRVSISKSIVITDGRNFYDQSINDLIKKYGEIRKTATGQEDDYTTGCLLDYQYFKVHYRLIEVDLDWIERKNWILIQEQSNKLSFMEC